LAVPPNRRLPGDLARSDRDLAHAEIAGDGIESRSLHFGLRIKVAFLSAELRYALAAVRWKRILHPDQFGLQIVKERMFRRPESGARHRNESFAIHTHRHRGYRAA